MNRRVGDAAVNTGWAMSGGAGAVQGRYLYERLSDKDFQRLCGALLARQYSGVRCYPVGHSDGGRDITHESAEGLVVYQVKWTSKPEQDPVAWLKAAIAGEADSIRRLVAKGASEYCLVTSVAGTAVPEKGMMDRLDVELRAYEEVFGIPMRVWWRSDVDARVDTAPAELKWSYLDMLAGHDLARYFTEASGGAAEEKALRSLVRKVVAAQWEEDAKTKFKQIDLTDHNLDDLFVDVDAVRLAPCGTGPRDEDPGQGQLVDERPFIEAPSPRHLFDERSEELGGAAAYLLAAHVPFTLVRGAPGQGKSTLGQYVCQRHRDAYVRGAAAPEHVPGQRLPLRVDLRDYSAWLVGYDPLGRGERVLQPSPRTCGGLEEFLAYLLTAYSGGLPADAATVYSLLDRFPVILVLDGLDEVASKKTRQRVVEEIDGFAARLRTARDAQLVVTTRPNAGDLAEPSLRLFEVISLSRLSRELQDEYFGKWVHARALPDRERTALRQTFQLRSTEPHIAQLSDNPMQLSILLYLMRKRTDSVPRDMTGLYTSYLEIFLDREAEKSATVAKHRDDLKEVTAYLGWHLQARAEADAENGRMTAKDLQKAIWGYLFEVEKDQSLFKELFTGATDRVWALTAKTQGTFEFDVQPMREYFAARFLREFAGADRRSFDSGEVLRELVRRAYWLNTCRFYAGFANPNELAGMLEDLEAEFQAGTAPEPVRAAAWTLLADGVFNGRVPTRRRAAGLLADDLSVRLVTEWLRNRSLPELTPDRGGSDLAQRLLERVAEQPESRATPERVGLAARICRAKEFNAWWRPKMLDAAGGEHEATWLSIAAATRTPWLDTADLDRLALSDDRAAVAAFAAGARPAPHSAMEQRLLRVVLDGLASEVAIPPWQSYPHTILEALNPHRLLSLATRRHGRARYPWLIGREAVERLTSRDERYAVLMRDERDPDTTAPWGDLARAVKELFGPCWLAAEIAVSGAIAASSDRVIAGDLTPGSEGFGDNPDYGRLLRDIHHNRSETSWWTDVFTRYDDNLSRAVWALSLVACADRDVVVSQLATLDRAVRQLSGSMLQALMTSSSRLGRFNMRRLPHVLAHAADHELGTVTLLSHFTMFHRNERLRPLSDATLTDMAQFGEVAWPAVRELTARMGERPSQALIDGLIAHGPTSRGFVRRMVRFAVNQEVRERVLATPFDFPRDWVLAAAEQTGTAADGGISRYLEQVARDNRWFAH